jgi:hypothetical protein
VHFRLGFSMKRITICAAVVLIAALIGWRFTSGNGTPQARAMGAAQPATKIVPDQSTEGGTIRENAGGFTGSGWSALPQTSQATVDAMTHALNASCGSPDLTLVFYNPQHDPQKILDALHHSDRPMGKIFGETTHDGLLLADGYHTSKQGVLGMLAMREAGTKVGIGGASFDEASPKEAAKLALQRAAENAGAVG